MTMARGTLSLLVSALALAGAVGCSTTLTEDECRTYRDRLVDWAAKKGEDRKAAADEFLKSCAGTKVSRGAHACMNKATDEKTFMACLE